MTILFDYNRTLFNPETESLYPGAVELLENLAPKAMLLLVSKNEPTRSDKLERLGIKKFFKKVAFVDLKTEQLFKDLVSAAGGTGPVLVVGDRVQGEIRVGKAAGFITVWVKQGKFAEILPTEEETPTYTVNDIRELQKIISTYEN
jgi:ribonucleotide monophosphatase NagD (HAD superfamily)